jgi:hypothetical protein
MMAMTTSSSISVNAIVDVGSRRFMRTG